MPKPRGTRPGASDSDIGQRAGTLSGVVVIAARSFMAVTVTERSPAGHGIYSGRDPWGPGAKSSVSVLARISAVSKYGRLAASAPRARRWSAVETRSR